MQKHTLLLKSIGACQESLIFADKYDSLYSAWNACDHINWKFWLIAHFDLPKVKQLAIIIAESVLPIYQAKYPDNNRPALAIQAAKDYLKRSISLEELRAAHADVGAAAAWADVAAANAAAGAAHAAACAAACAAARATWTADAAAWAAAAAAWAADAAPVTNPKLDINKLINENFDINSISY